ncbi:MAG TPA: Gfo/Idh/MocA family oxidoreductase, partial [Euzebyales bacterium]|nr:Gfo/Idh/MocA family oxidoreductase [Euzebyales bacterium]
MQYALGLLRDGRLGTITHYRGRFLNGYAGDPAGVLSWRFEADQGLGTLGDLMVHAIDMALVLAGPIDGVVADRETFIRQRPLPSGEGTHYDVGDADSPRGGVTNEDYVSA